LKKLVKLAQSEPDYIATICDLPVASYDRRVDALQGHEATIKLFDEALADRSQWPTADRAVKQNVSANTYLRGAGSLTLKTGWDTSLKWISHSKSTTVVCYQTLTRRKYSEQMGRFSVL
jgi:hypothetical protein